MFLVEYPSTKQNKPGHSVGCEYLAAKTVFRRKKLCHRQRAKQKVAGIFGLLQLSFLYGLYVIGNAPSPS
jgi:hypothetical protein